MNTHVFVLDTGTSTVAKKVLLATCSEPEKPVKIPILAYLIKTEEAMILVDTSFASPDRPDLKAAGYERRLGRTQEPIGQLRNLGVEPEDIDIVVNTHLHEDHCGNNKLFMKSRFLVQKEELRHAFVPDENERDSTGPFYKRVDFDYPLNYEPITGDFDLTAGVRLISTPGHTAGHQSVLVKLKQSNFVIASDAVFTEMNWRDDVPSGVVHDPKAYMNSIRKLRTIENAFIYFSHDMDFFRRTPRNF
jgi:glyoxylase-like metal-dependent hydrolase (beta-lactamase superfamily II)